MNTISVLEYKSSANTYGSLKTWKNINIQTYIHWPLRNYVLTPWSRILLEKLTGL
jgi:hypothetical protein